jgi:hypothetical protein
MLHISLLVRHPPLVIGEMLVLSGNLYLKFKAEILGIWESVAGAVGAVGHGALCSLIDIHAPVSLIVKALQTFAQRFITRLHRSCRSTCRSFSETMRFNSSAD